MIHADLLLMYTYMHTHDQIISRIGRVIIAGNLLAPFDTAILKEKHMSQKQQDFAQPFKHLDLLLSQVNEEGQRRSRGAFALEGRPQPSQLVQATHRHMLISSILCLSVCLSVYIYSWQLQSLWM